MHPAGPALTVVIVGPTGVGKTALGSALAERFPCHLVSADALQVYRDLVAATGKPRGAEARRPWALVDLVEPHRDFNLGDWVRAAEAELAYATLAGRTPVVVGGTGLYVRGLLKGVAAAPARDETLRARLGEVAARRGVPFLHRLLRRLDPATAAQLTPNDRQRLVRALEVRLTTGKSLARLQQTAAWRGADRTPALRIGLSMPREELVARLDARVQRFFDDGLIAETRWLLEVRRVPPQANALKAIGYRETVRWLVGGRPSGVDELVAEVQRSTRQYAKRQMTWFRAEPGVIWLDARDPGLVDRAAQVVAKDLAREA